jgi:hypothetical protein
MSDLNYLSRLAASAPFEPPPMFDYRNNPLGKFAGEEGLQVPYNAVTTAIVRVRNLSGSVKRKIVKEWVSFATGGEDSILEGPYKGKNMTPQELQRQALSGRNVNWEVEAVRPQDFILRFDDRRWVIPALGEDGEAESAPEVIVPEGVWDLYCGNFGLMNALMANGQPDVKTRAQELERVQFRGLNRFVYGGKNQYGFLQFTREALTTDSIPLDRARILEGEIIEV